MRGMKTFARLSALLSLLLLAACASVAPAPATRPAVLLVSIDGLRADVVGTGRMPTLDALARDGVRAEWMNPSYPTLTFPNHYTLVTGLRPDHHGIVHNSMRDPELGRFSLGRREAVADARWWNGGEPAWVTVQKHGGRAATMFWPGSEAPVRGQHPDEWRPFDAAVTAAQRVDQVLAWLERPAATRPGFVTLYFDQVDHEAHAAGPDSAPAHAAMAEVDAALARLFDGLSQRGLRDAVDLVLVSDHGMAPSGPAEFFEDWLQPRGLGLDAIDIVMDGQVAGVVPRGNVAAVEAALLGRHPHAECWRREDLPERWHYGTHPRVPPIVCQADTGWRIATKDRARPSAGSHGYAPEDPSMRAVFVADGPSFRDGAVLPPFDNVDVYPLLMRLLGVPAQANDGDVGTLQPALR
jgi:predicted AlkP superfamily pyrophosphatase or phosphodiesterase